MSCISFARLVPVLTFCGHLGLREHSAQTAREAGLFGNGSPVVTVGQRHRLFWYGRRNMRFPILRLEGGCGNGGG